MSGLILLMQPGTFEMLGSNEYPLELSYIGASLVSNKKVELYDFRTVRESRRYTTVQHFLGKRPWMLVVAISPRTINAAQDLLKDFKHYDPGIKTVVIGTITKWVGRHFLYKCAAVDYAILGCNRSAVSRLVSALENDAKLGDVPGLAYRNGGKIVKNRIACPESGEDESPLDLPTANLMPWINNNRPIKYTSLFATSGMRFAAVASSQADCAEHGSLEVGWIKRNPANVSKEIVRLVCTLGVKHIDFVDELFSSDWHRAVDIIETAKESSGDFTFSLVARWNQIISPSAQLARLHQLGLTWVNLRLSIAPDSTNYLGISETLGMNDKAVELIRSAGLKVYMSGAFWHPESTIRDIEIVCEFLLRKKLFFPKLLFNQVPVFPGTESGFPTFEYDFVDKDVGHLYRIMKKAQLPIKNRYQDILKLRCENSERSPSQLRQILREIKAAPFILLKNLLDPTDSRYMKPGYSDSYVRQVQNHVTELYSKAKQLYGIVQ